MRAWRATGAAVSNSTLCVGMMITMVSVLYSALRAGSNSQFFKVSDEDGIGDAVGSRYTNLMAPPEEDDGVELEPDDPDLETQVWLC